MKGIKIATTNCGIKYKNRDDLLFITFEKSANVAGVFTTTSMPAAPVSWCKKNIKNGKAKALVVNAGNANAFTGKEGENTVLQTAKKAAALLNCSEEEIFISSTGVIGEPLKYELITNALEKISADFADEKTWDKAAKAIMTTDTKQKLVKKTCEIAGEKIELVGFAKGSGMIAPNMATMLGYIFTNANISSEVLSILLKEISEKTFNSITVDSDTSTNDSVFLFATKEANHKEIFDVANSQIADFKKTLFAICLELAQMIVIDGEGATKLIEIEISGAKNYERAKNTASAIANSPLVKTAIAGCDPNWGRIVMAVGKSCSETSPEKLIVKFGDFQITQNGGKHPNYIEKEVHEYLKNSKVKISVNLGIGSESATIWTCDLNEEYIKINKDYRS